MIFPEKAITLKDGRTAILKSPCVSDAEKMLGYIKKACGETNFLLRYPEDFNMTMEQEEAWILGLRSSSDSLAIACYVEGEIAGNCEIHFMTGMKTKHRAAVHIAILKDYWSLGIGSAMFTELIAAAKENPDTEIVELEFLEGNDRARALYEKFEFCVVGERPHAFRLKDGTMLKEIFMQRQLRG